MTCRHCKVATTRLSRICQGCQDSQRKRYVKQRMVAQGDSIRDVVERLPAERAQPTWAWWYQHDELAVECAEVMLPNSAGVSRLQKYKLPVHEWFYLVAKQKGGCAICKRQTHPLALNIDHDHGNGLVRGLLCTPCNTGLGLLGIDDGDLAVDRAVIVLAYVREAADAARRRPKPKNKKGSSVKPGR